LWSVAGFAQPDPTTERGMRPGLAYRVEGLDNVNVFNGTMTINIPLGQTYPVNGPLAYSFIASYATNAWESGEHDVDIYGSGGVQTETYQYSFPSRYANAGFGWIVTLGLLKVTEGSTATTYVAPDGSEHEFATALHFNDPNETPSTAVQYTHDGTYLRLKLLTNERRLEFPNGVAHRFDLTGRLFRMEDPFGNHVDVQYLTRLQVDGPSGNTVLDDSTVWKITDSVGREHKVYFRPGWRTLEDYWGEWDPEPYKVEHELVDKVVLAAFNGSQAQYTFNYDPATLPENVTYDTNGEPNVAHRTSRRCKARKLDPYTSFYETVGILTSIGMPHGRAIRWRRIAAARPAAVSLCKADIPKSREWSCRPVDGSIGRIRSTRSRIRQVYSAAVRRSIPVSCRSE
jgi:hypothetical protein